MPVFSYWEGLSDDESKSSAIAAPGPVLVQMFTSWHSYKEFVMEEVGDNDSDDMNKPPSWQTL